MALFIGDTGNSSGDPELMMDINTTPLIDVMLVLLVMLIITIPIQLHAVNMEMPVGPAPTASTQTEKIQIDIDAQDIIYWQGVAVSTAQLEERLLNVKQLLPQPELHIRANKNSTYAAFTKVLASTRRQGLSQVAIVGSEQYSQ